MAEAKIAFNNRMWKPQEMNPYVAYNAMSETAWTSLAYGLAAKGYFFVWTSDEKSTIPVDTLYDDAVSLSLGVLTIQLPHINTCSRLICNCKIQ